MATQIAGNINSSTVAEVEINTKALRTVIRPDDYGSLGIYSLAANNGATAMTAGLAASSPIFSFRGASATNLMIVKKIIIGAFSGTTGFALGTCTFGVLAARSFTVSDSGGTSILPSGNGNKLRTSMGTTTAQDIRIASTGTLTAGTRTLDAQNFASAFLPVGTATWTPMIGPGFALFDQRVGEFPLVLAANEGFVIQASVPGTGVWFFYVYITWEELAAY